MTESTTNVAVRFDDPKIYSQWEKLKKKIPEKELEKILYQGQLLLGIAIPKPSNRNLFTIVFDYTRSDFPPIQATLEDVFNYIKLYGMVSAHSIMSQNSYKNVSNHDLMRMMNGRFPQMTHRKSLLWRRFGLIRRKQKLMMLFWTCAKRYPKVQP